MLPFLIGWFVGFVLKRFIYRQGLPKAQALFTALLLAAPFFLYLAWLEAPQAAGLWAVGIGMPIFFSLRRRAPALR